MSERSDAFLVNDAHQSVLYDAKYYPTVLLYESFMSEGGVYFARNKSNGLTKIGCTSSFKKRLKQLRYSSSIAGAFDNIEFVLTIGMAKGHEAALEGFIHRDYHEQRVGSEWYNLSDENISEIEANASEYVHAILSRDEEKIKAKYIAEHSPLRLPVLPFGAILKEHALSARYKRACGSIGLPLRFFWKHNITMMLNGSTIDLSRSKITYPQ